MSEKRPPTIRSPGGRAWALTVGGVLVLWSAWQLLDDPPADAGASAYLVGCLALGALIYVRGSSAGLLVRPNEVIVRNLFWTHRWTWHQIDSFSVSAWRIWTLKVRPQTGMRILVDAIQTWLPTSRGRRALQELADSLNELKRVSAERGIVPQQHWSAWVDRWSPNL